MNPSYRKRVSIIKYSALIVAAGLFIVAYLSSGNESNVVKNYEKEKQEKISQLRRIKDNHSLSISQTVFKGVSEDNSPYEIFADQVEKTSENKFRLKDIDAKYEIEAGDLEISALSGIFNNQKNHMKLRNGVVLKIDELELKTEEMSINLEKRKAESKNEVEVKYKNSEISADSFKTEEEADIIEFNGNVHSRFNVSDF